MSEPHLAGLALSGVHRLFLPEEPDDEPVIGIKWITVKRLAPAGGTAGRVFDAEHELPDLLALQARFGGGTYEVKGRNEAYQVLKGAVRRYQLDGRPIPMEEPHTGVPPVGHPYAPAGAPPSAEVETLRGQVRDLAVLVQQLAQRPAAAAVPPPPADAMLTAVLEGQRRMMDSLSSTLSEVLKRKEEPLQTHDVFLAGLNAGIQQADAITSAIQSARGAHGSGDDGDEDALLKTVQAVVEGVKAFSGGKPAAPTGEHA